MWFDEIATSHDVGRINPEDKILPQEIHCPKMVWGGKKITRPTIALSQCIMRIEERSSCTKSCPIAKQIQKKIANGYEYHD